jgi:predicted NBD/HSP70 family sugar kinase
MLGFVNFADKGARPLALLRKATNQRTRRINEQLVLRTVYERSPISRAEVARVTGLTRTTVSEVVDSLIGRDLVEEAGTGPSTGGKLPILLRVPADARHLVGVDVDDDQLSGAVVNLQGEIRHRESVPLAGRDGERAAADLEVLVDRLVASTERPLLGIGVATPGLVDTTAGVVRWAVNLDWRDLPLGERLRARTGLPVYVVNDSQAAAMAEWTFGEHVRAMGMVVVKVGNGIGAGVIIDGQLFQGDSSGAGEIGHTRVVADGPGCHCGGRGCLELVASVRAAVVRAADGAASRPESLLASSPVTFEALVEASASGDPLAREVVEEVGRPLGWVLGAVIGILGIHDIVLIGPMTALGEPWLGAVREEARRSALPLLAEQSRIRIGRLGPDVVELGTAALLMNAELGLALAA